MPIGETNRTKLKYVEETTYGVTPSAQLQLLRFTEESLVENSNTVTSSEIRSDRNIQEYVQVSAAVSGSIGFELSYGTYDDMFEGALASTDFSAAVTETLSTISIVDTAGDLSIDDSGSGFTPADWPIGKWVKVEGFTTTNTGVHYAVVSGTATSSSIPVKSATLAAEAAGDSVTISNDGMIRNGTTQRSYSFEKELIDLTKFFSYTGGVINTMSLAINSESILSGSFGVIGRGETQAASSIGTGADLAATTSKILNASNNVLQIVDADSAATWHATDIGIETTNNAEARPAVGELNPFSVRFGSFEATASASVYLTDTDAFYTKYKAQTQHRFAFFLQDPDGNTYVVTMHKGKVLQDQNPTSGQNADYISSINIGSEYDSETGCTIQIDRFDA